MEPPLDNMESEDIEANGRGIDDSGDQRPRRFATPVSDSRHDVFARDSISVAAEEEINASDLSTKLKRKWSNFLFSGNLKSFYPERQVYGRWDNIVLAYQSLGVVFGDLGTSPLYVYPTITLNNPPTETDCLGILSIIFWTMTMVSLIKYICFVMAADDHGEGGTFAVYSLLCQHANVGLHGSNLSAQVQSDRQLTHFTKKQDLGRKNRTIDFFEGSSLARRVLLVVVIIGAGMVFGDGVLTPAISVLSAVGGIKSQFPSISQSVVLVISVFILVMLFMLQRFGTRRVSFLFSPIMVIWCITIFSIGVYNIFLYEPQVFKAVSPHYIILFFRHNHKSAWVSLGGVVLCITGAEAMFADMGHFSKKSIQMAFLTMVYPSTLAAYAGETAFVIKHPEHHADAFFKSVPHGIFWPVLVISTLAAIVASQSLISASFSVVKQAMALGCFPRVKLVHTSSRQEGQIYSPEINYALMIFCVIVVAGFRDARQIGNAFGVTVVWVMVLTTCLISLVMLIIWETPWYLVVAFLAVYGIIEGVYLTSVLYKFPQGGWVPFAISFLFGIVMLSWNYGHRKKFQYELEAKLGMDGLASLLQNSKIQRVPGICFFYTNLVQGIPPIIAHYVKNVRTLHQIIVFTTIRYVPVVTVLPSERFLVSRVGHRGVYRCVARYGYMDSISVEDSAFKEQLLQSLQEYLLTPGPYQARFTKHPSITEFCEANPPEATLPAHDHGTKSSEELEELAAAGTEEVVYVLGKTRLSANPKAQFWKKLVLGRVYAFLRNNCRRAFDDLRIPPSNLLEVGMVYDVI